MAARGIRGQSVASSASGVALFGGFDDYILRVEPTGRVVAIDSVGRTVLYPWDATHFVCLEEALGRPSKTRLTLRPYADPSEVESENGEWSKARRLVPGHYPTVFAMQDGQLDEIESARPPDSEAAVGFVPGVFVQDVPTLVDGAWTATDGATVAGPAVGREAMLFVAASDALVVVDDGVVKGRNPMGESWHPAVIEHDPVGGNVLVASWNRWRSLGGPSTDVYAFDAAGSRIGTGRIESLVERMAVAEHGVVTMDVVGNSAFVELVGFNG